MESQVKLNFAEVNTLAVLVAGLATFLLGGVWYTALFGKKWQQLMGFTPEMVKELQAKMKPLVFFGGMIICYLVVAAVMGVLVSTFNITGWLDGLVFGLLLWLGVAAPIGFTHHLSNAKPISVFLINISYEFLFLAMCGAILGGWR
jgi:hypothetical protein